MSELRVIPGYQRFNRRQRECLLTLHERKLVRSPVRVKRGPTKRDPRRPVIVVDRAGLEVTLYPNGSTLWQE